MILPGTLGEEGVSILFDTGAPRTLVSTELVAKHPNSFRFLSYQYVLDVNGEKVKEEAYVSTMSKAVQSKKAADEYSIILGAKQMQKLHWAFDLKQKNWKVW